MEVVYISVKPPEQVAIKMLEGPLLFRTFAGAWNFKSLSSSRTQVTFRYHFEVRPRWLHLVLDPIVARILDRDMRARLAGLKAFAESPDDKSCSVLGRG